MAENGISATVSSTVGPSGLRRKNVVVSDQHVSAGRWLELRRPRSWRKRRERGGLPGLLKEQPVERVPNPLEDFHLDDEWQVFLRRIGETHGDADMLTLRMNGDCLDFHAVPWKGRIADPPFEYVARAKLLDIYDGHPGYFAGLRDFLRPANRRLVVTPGNHDLHLCWPKVQSLFIRLVSGGDRAIAAKIRFVDQRHEFRDFEDGVLYEHGNNAEPHNTVDPKNVIITHWHGKKLRQPILNQPIGSIITLTVVLPIKLRNDLIGRVPEEPLIWKYASGHQWIWALFAGYALTRALVHNNLFAFWDYRRKASFAAQWQTIMSSPTGDNPVNAYGQKLLRTPIEVNGERVHPRAVVQGHSHGPWFETGPHGTSMNTGHWSMRMNIDWPTFEPRWRSLRWFEGKLWAFRHYLTPTHIAKAVQYLKLALFMAGVVGVIAFLGTTFREDETLLTFRVLHVKWFLTFALAVYLFLGFVKIFAVRPKISRESLLTYGLVRANDEGELKVDLKRFVPEAEPEKQLIDYV